MPPAKISPRARRPAHCRAMAGVVFLLSTLFLALGAPPAGAFTPFPVAGGPGEHRRISDAALACRWGGPSSCWSPRALDRLETALRRPDVTLATFEDAAHCDSGDLAADGTSPGGRGPAALAACRDWIRKHIALALVAADGLVDARGVPLHDVRDCSWRALRPRTPLCETDFHLGRALHAAQDFYAHTNWVDSHDPGKPLSLRNPPGLGRTGPIEWLASDADEPPPPGLMSGCFVFFPEALFCHGRTRHRDLSKDSRAGPGSPPVGASRRGAINGAFPRAFDAAADETARIWMGFHARLLSTYGEVRGRAMSCRLRGLPPSVCG